MYELDYKQGFINLIYECSDEYRMNCIHAITSMLKTEYRYYPSMPNCNHQLILEYVFKGLNAWRKQRTYDGEMTFKILPFATLMYMKMRYDSNGNEWCSNEEIAGYCDAIPEYIRNRVCYMRDKIRSINDELNDDLEKFHEPLWLMDLYDVIPFKFRFLIYQAGFNSCEEVASLTKNEFAKIMTKKMFCILTENDITAIENALALNGLNFKE